MSSRRILLVEDEAALAQLLEKHLTRLGFEVKKEATALGSLLALESAPAAFDLVLADMGLPDMPGPALVSKMFEICPNVRVLICSGSEFFVSTLPEEIQPRVKFLQKPFAPRELGQKIDEMLGRAGV